MKSKQEEVMKIIICIAIFFLINVASAETIYVGPGEKYSALEEVEDVLEDGDILEIVPGTYRQCTTFYANDLVVRPKGWPNNQGKVRYQDVTCQGKAIFVVEGDRIRIDGIEFINAKVPDQNGAGIKFNGKYLEVNDSYFFNNEVGIMTGDDFESEIVVHKSVFEGNGKEPPRWGHGLYVNDAKTLKVTDSLFIKQKTGHHIKSRALYTEVSGNEIADGMEGNASYSIDIANGGSVLIENNIIQKGPLSDNITTVICIACEGGTNETKKIIIRNNQFTNDTSSDNVVFVRNLTSTKEEIKDNQFKGNKIIRIERDYPG